MHGHQPLDGGQPDAVALELIRRVVALERPEEVPRRRHVEAGTVVADEEGALAPRSR